MDRRTLLSAAVGASVSALTSPHWHSAQAAGFDYGDPQDLLTALVKLRGSTDGTLVFWWLRGIRYGVVDAVVTPFFQTNAASIQRFERQDDGSYMTTFLEASYYTDIESGELLKDWRNPYTDKINKVEPVVLGPVKNRLTVNGMSAPEDPPGVTMEMSSNIGPAIVVGDDIWIKADTTAQIVANDGSRPTYNGNDLSTYQGRKSDVEDASRASADATVHYQSATNWRSWMGLQDVKGHLMARAVGRKVKSVDEFPDEYMALLNSQNPGLFDDPEAAMQAAPPPSSFMR